VIKAIKLVLVNHASEAGGGENCSVFPYILIEVPTGKSMRNYQLHFALHFPPLPDSENANGKRLRFLQKAFAALVREVPKGQKEKRSGDLGEGRTL
jgi:hypothetical protein